MFALNRRMGDDGCITAGKVVNRVSVDPSVCGACGSCSMDAENTGAMAVLNLSEVAELKYVQQLQMVRTEMISGRLGLISVMTFLAFISMKVASGAPPHIVLVMADDQGWDKRGIMITPFSKLRISMQWPNRVCDLIDFTPAHRFVHQRALAY